MQTIGKQIFAAMMSGLQLTTLDHFLGGKALAAGGTLPLKPHPPHTTSRAAGR